MPETFQSSSKTALNNIQFMFMSQPSSLADDTGQLRPVSVL